MDAGAVIFAKTNMTQLGDTWGGGNPAYGDTLNPWGDLVAMAKAWSGEIVALGGAAPYAPGSAAAPTHGGGCSVVTCPLAQRRPAELTISAVASIYTGEDDFTIRSRGRSLL